MVKALTERQKQRAGRNGTGPTERRSASSRARGRRCPATKKGQNPNTVDREEPEADPAAVKGAASATRVAAASGLY